MLHNSQNTSKHTHASGSKKSSELNCHLDAMKRLDFSALTEVSSGLRSLYNKWVVTLIEWCYLVCNR